MRHCQNLLLNIQVVKLKAEDYKKFLLSLRRLPEPVTRFETA
jgi:hypothetical protein